MKTFLAALAAALLLTGCTATTSTAPAATHSVGAAAPVPTQDVGKSFTNPAALTSVVKGTDLSGEPFSFSFSAVNFNANAAVAAANQFNAAPSAGGQYLSVELTIKNTGTAKSTDAGSVLARGINFMTSTGQTIAPSTTLAFLADPLTSAPAVPAGGNVTGSIVYEVPVGTTTGVFEFSNMFVSAN